MRSWVLGEFASEEAILAAARALRAKGHASVDLHSPVPIHGAEEALGLRRSRVPLVALLDSPRSPPDRALDVDGVEGESRQRDPGRSLRPNLDDVRCIGKSNPAPEELVLPAWGCLLIQRAYAVAVEVDIASAKRRANGTDK